jgi:hypothetical protein
MIISGWQQWFPLVSRHAPTGVWSCETCHSQSNNEGSSVIPEQCWPAISSCRPTISGQDWASFPSENRRKWISPSCLGCGLWEQAGSFGCLLFARVSASDLSDHFTALFNPAQWQEKGGEIRKQMLSYVAGLQSLQDKQALANQCAGGRGVPGSV